MTDTITALRQRMAAGEPIEGDLTWCKRRLEVLNDWPDPLSLEQHKEANQLRAWLHEYREDADALLEQAK